jgi:RNAse (barnase) inhibitor barstar
MHEIYLDATNCRTVDDFYDAIFTALGSPKWHGRNFNALRDSITGGQINDVEPPFELYLSGSKTVSGELKPVIRDFVDFIKNAKADGYEVDVMIQD